MKTTILNIGKLLLLSVGVTLVSCEDWLDVRPKSEILTDVHLIRLMHRLWPEFWLKMT